MPTLRRAALASILLAACSASPRTTIVVQSGVELVCTARAPAAPDAAAPAAPDAAAPAVPDASTADVGAVTPDAPPAPPAPPVDPSRLVLLPAERAYASGRVVRCEGPRALVLLADGAVVARAVAALRAPRLPPGAEVMALWGEGAGEPYHAVVLDSDRGGVRVRYDDGSEERLPFHRLQRVTRASGLVPAAAACVPTAGALTAVLVPEGAVRRVAVVVEAGGPSVLVETRDGRSTVPAAGLSRLALAAGDRVMVRWRDSGDYAARVRGVEGAAVAVTYDDGSEESIHPAQVLSWSAPEGTSRALPPFR